MKNLNKFHYDFIKIKAPSVEESKINWHNLEEHPNLKRHYTLSPKTGLEFCKNFDMYLSKRGDMVIRTSMPYLIFGHNHVAFDLDEAVFCIDELQRLLGVDLQEAFVEEFEYGCYETLDTSCEKYIQNIKGMNGYDLVMAKPYMKMFDNGVGVKYKVYDAIANAKRKKTFTRAKFQSDNVVKHEYKMVCKELSAGSIPVKWFLTEKFTDTVEGNLCGLIENFKGLFDGCELDISEAKKLNEILFVALKKVQQEQGIDIIGLTLKMIKQMDLTSSQKSKRILALSKLNNKFNKAIQKE